MTTPDGQCHPLRHVPHGCHQQDLHFGLLQDLDGILYGEVPLGLVHPAGGVVADGVLPQLVGNLKLQPLLTLAEGSLPCNAELSQQRGQTKTEKSNPT